MEVELKVEEKFIRKEVVTPCCRPALLTALCAPVTLSAENNCAAPHVKDSVGSARVTPAMNCFPVDGALHSLKMVPPMTGSTFVKTVTGVRGVFYSYGNIRFSSVGSYSSPQRC